jgi:hypothetical protein
MHDTSEPLLPWGGTIDTYIVPFAATATSAGVYGSVLMVSTSFVPLLVEVMTPTPFENGSVTTYVFFTPLQLKAYDISAAQQKGNVVNGDIEYVARRMSVSHGISEFDGPYVHPPDHSNHLLIVPPTYCHLTPTKTMGSHNFVAGCTATGLELP